MSARGDPTRADDELVLSWLVLSESGFPRGLMAKMCGVRPADIRAAVAAVMVADKQAHRLRLEVIQ